MSVPLDPTRSLWYESMQDMSGFVLSDTILPPLDEQLDLTISTAQFGNDFNVHNPGLLSPAEFILEDHSDDVISEESDMFDNTICETLSPKINECQSESPGKGNLFRHMDSIQTRTTKNMGDEKRNLSSQKLPFFRPKVKVTAIVNNEKPKYLAIIDSEEPLIKEDPDLMFYNQYKMNFNIKDEVDVSDVLNSEPSINEDLVDCSGDMDVAGEVEVTTETDEGGKCKANLNISPLYSLLSDSEEDLNISEEKLKREGDVVFHLDPLHELESVMDDLFNGLGGIEDDLYSHIREDYHVNSTITPEEIEEDYAARHSIPPLNELLNNSSDDNSSDDKSFPTTNLLNDSNQLASEDGICRIGAYNQMTSKPILKPTTLTLDISAARAALLDEKGISDTPELLEALKPEVGKFDLIKFITTNGDPNNNATCPPTGFCPKKPEVPRKGKSHLTLLELKKAQELGRDQSLPKGDEQMENEPLPSVSGTSATQRPARQSATRFKKMIEEGLLSSVVNSQCVSSDDEDDAPKNKRWRTTSINSSRRRLNSDSDRSSVSEDAMKYRERRDRNNLSSKRSRQKRKMQYLMKQKEMKELEDKNTSLRLKAKQLESVLSRVKDYLAHMKDNDKDRGDEH